MAESFANKENSGVAVVERQLGREIGVRLAEVRRSLNLSQKEVARRAGMSQPEVSRLERGGGGHSFTLSTLERVAAVCGLQVNVGLSERRGSTDGRQGRSV